MNRARNQTRLPDRGRSRQVGFSQRIRLEWLDKTANLVLAGNDQSVINAALQELLRDKVSIGGKAERGNREKIISILMKIWHNPPRELEELRDDGIKLLRGLQPEHRIAIHWGMVLAVYPFWGAVASQTGRLLRLQGTAAASHVQRRVREQYGERETVSRAARRVLRSFIDWNVLNETGQKGVYRQGNVASIQDSRLVAWLVEASLHARENGSAPIKDLLENSGLFPFRLAHVPGDLLASKSPRLDLLRHGLDDDLVMLCDRGIHKITS
jgi:hypothetical protein